MKRSNFTKTSFPNILLNIACILKCFLALYFTIFVQSFLYSSFGLENYDWEITTPSTIYRTKGKEFQFLRNNLENILDNAYSIKLERKHYYNSLLQKDAYGDLTQGQKFLYKVTELLVEESSAVDTCLNIALFFDLKYLVGLEKLTIKSPAKHASLHARSLLHISECKKLTTLVLDIENVSIIGSEISLILPSLQVFYIKNREFSGKILLHEAHAIYSIEICIAAFKGFDLVYFYFTGIPQEVHATVYTNSTKHISFIAVANPSFFLELIELDSGMFCMPEITEIPNCKIAPGASAYITRIISEKVLQSSQPLFSCNGQYAHSWSALYTHLTEKHQNKSIVLSTYIEKKRNALSLFQAFLLIEHTYTS